MATIAACPLGIIQQRVSVAIARLDWRIVDEGCFVGPAAGRLATVPVPSCMRGGGPKYAGRHSINTGEHDIKEEGEDVVWRP